MIADKSLLAAWREDNPGLLFEYDLSVKNHDLYLLAPFRPQGPGRSVDFGFGEV